MTSIVLEETSEKAIPEVATGDVVLFGEVEPMEDGFHVRLNILQVRVSLSLGQPQKTREWGTRNRF